MLIYFYSSTNEMNAFPKSLTSETIFNGTIREDSCDILNPVIRFTGLMPNMNFNYAYMPDFKRYYFITSITSIRTNILEISFHVDVLQSWSEYILDTVALVDRCEDVNHANFRITDDKIITYPYQKRFERIELEGANPLNSEYGCVIIQTSNDHSTSLLGATITEAQDNIYKEVAASGLQSSVLNEYTYILDAQALRELTQDFSTVDLKEFLYGNPAVSASSFFSNLAYCPFDITKCVPSECVNSTFRSMLIGKHRVDLPAGNIKVFGLYSNAPIAQFRLDINYNFKNKFTSDLKPILYYKDDFRNYSPFSNWYINLPYYGTYGINPLLYIDYNYIDIRYYLDIQTGNVLIKIIGGYSNQIETLIDSLQTNVYTPVNLVSGDLTSTQRLTLGLFNIATNFALNEVANVAGFSATTSTTNTHSQQTIQKRNSKTGRLNNAERKISDYSEETTTTRGSHNYTTEILPTINNAYEQSRGGTSINGAGTGILNGCYNKSCFLIHTIIDNEFPENFANLQGYICNNSDKLGNFNGFTRIVNAHLNIPAFTDELDEIDSLLHDGVLINKEE